MKNSSIFYTNKYKEIEKKIMSFLNKQKDFLSLRSINSPRAVGDAIESIISDNFQTILGLEKLENVLITSKKLENFGKRRNKYYIIYKF